MKHFTLLIFAAFLCTLQITNAQNIAEGGSFTVVLCADGTAQAWGANYVGQLGDNGTGDNSPVPVDVYAIDNLKTIASGTTFSLALKNDGTVWAWGENMNGGCGDGTTITRFAPVQVYGPDSISFLDEVIDIAAGNQVGIALKADGTVWSWGATIHGCAGDGGGLGISHLYPVQVVGLDGVGFLEDVIQIEASNYSVYALKSDGTVWAWGENVEKQLGDGTEINRLTPIQIPGLTDIENITAGTACAYAIKSDGTVWGWGANDYGKLGTGASDLTYSTPVQMVDVEGAVAAAAGQHFVMILTNEGAVFTCGNNSDGQLGDGTVENKSTAIGLVGLDGIIEIAAGGKTAVVLDNDGNIYAWGDNMVGQIGDGTLSDKWTPTPVTSACSMLLATSDLAESQSGFDVYPNPVDDYLFVQHTDANNHTLQLIDINGKIISSIISNNSTNKIDVFNLPAGIYLLRDANYLNAIKIIVE